MQLSIQHAGGTIGLQGSIKQRLIRQARPSPNLLASTVVRTSRCSWPIKRIWLHYTTANSLRKQRMRCRKTVYPFWMWAWCSRCDVFVNTKLARGTWWSGVLLPRCSHWCLSTHDGNTQCTLMRSSKSSTYRTALVTLWLFNIAMEKLPIYRWFTY